MTDKYNGKELFTKDTKGKTRFWKATSNLELNADGHISILIEHGVLGSDKIVKKERFTKSGKNANKANQTTIEEQALLDISYLYQKQLDDGYVFDLDSYTEPLRPQLAHPYEKRKHTVKFDYKHPTAPNDYSNRYYASKKLDGCLHEDTLILTNKGYKTLGVIVDQKLNLSVQSYNKNTGKLEFKKILNWFDNGTSTSDNWLEILTNNQSIKCTKNHKIFTNSGWKEASSLDQNKDLIYTNDTSNLNSLLLGTLLGDSCLTIEKRNVKKSKRNLNSLSISYRLLFGHANKTLFDFKVNLFGLKGKESTRTSGYGSLIHCFYSKVLSKTTFPIHELYDVDPFSKNFGQRKLISLDFLLKNFTLDSLSLWLADDGSIRSNNGNPDTPVMHISSMGFSKEQNIIFQKMFEILFDVKPTLTLEKRISDPSYFLNFKTKDTLKLLKLLELKQCKGVEYKYHFPVKDYLRLENTSSFINFEKKLIKSSNIRKLDIEVEQNHNYFANNLLVHNCRLFVFVSNGKVVKFESRTGKPFKYFSHIATAIENNLSDVDKVLNNVVFDGELFNKNIPFNVLSSLINSDDYTTTEFNSVTYTTEQVQFHCYDRVNLDKKEEDYFTRFVNVSIPAENNIVFKIDNKIIKNEQDLITLGGKWISEGYEGLMLRNGWTPYDFGKRSNNLLKYKIMLDEEFLILDIIDSENEPGQPIFVVEVQKATDKEEALTCNVRMKGEKKENEKYLINKKDYINKWLKVQYQTKSEYNIPLFPVGLEVREGTVIDGKFIPTF